MHYHGNKKKKTTKSKAKKPAVVKKKKPTQKGKTVAKKSNFQKGVEFIKKQSGKLKGKKRHQMGLGGKVGATIAGVGPLAISALDAASNTHRRITTAKVLPLDAISAGLMQFVNNLGDGFGFGAPFKEVTVGLTTGARQKINLTGNVPRGSLWGVVLTGGTMMGVDRFLSWVSGHGVNIPMTKVRAIGN